MRVQGGHPRLILSGRVWVSTEASCAALARRCVRSSRDARESAFVVVQVVIRVLVRVSGPGHRLAESVAGLPSPPPPSVGEVGLELAALGLELAAFGLDVGLGPVFPEQLADGGGAAPQSANCDASETARERHPFGAVAPSQLDALAGVVGAQLADRRTARRGRGGAGGGVRLGACRLVGSPFAAPALDPLGFGGPLTPHLAALPFEQPRPLRTLVGRSTGA